MAEHKTIGRISVVIDTENRQQRIGDVSAGFDEMELRHMILKYGHESLCTAVGYLQFQIYKVLHEVNAEKDKLGYSNAAYLVSPALIAHLCNDDENAHRYMVDEYNECYHDGVCIGKVDIVTTKTGLDINYTPYNSVSSVAITVVDKDGNLTIAGTEEKIPNRDF